MASARKNSRRRHERITQVDEVAIRLRVEPLDEGGFVATSPDLPGLVAEGRSVSEAVEIAQGLGRKILESCIEHGDPHTGRHRHSASGNDVFSSSLRLDH